mgnify:CR=1 FL=1
MRFLGGAKQSLSLLTVSLLAATVMPTASLAEGEDAPSGDFTVNVYADLDAFGDQCEVGAGTASVEIETQPFVSALSPDSFNIELGQLSQEMVVGNYFSKPDTSASSSEVEVLDVFEFFGVDPELLRESWPELENEFVENSRILAVRYDSESEGGAIEFDLYPYGVINSTEVEAFADQIVLARQTITSPEYVVSFEADSCNSEAFGVLTATRSEVTYQAENEQAASIEVAGDPSDQDPNTFFGTAMLITDITPWGQEYGIPYFLATSPPNQGDDFGGYGPEMVGAFGQQSYTALIHLFGNAPAGRFAVSFDHRLYVDAIQYASVVP